MRTIALGFQAIGFLVGLFYALAGLSAVDVLGFPSVIQGVVNALFYGGVLVGIGLILMVLEPVHDNSANILNLLNRIVKRNRE